MHERKNYEPGAAVPPKAYYVEDFVLKTSVWLEAYAALDYLHGK